MDLFLCLAYLQYVSVKFYKPWYRLFYFPQKFCNFGGTLIYFSVILIAFGRVPTF